MILTSLSPNQAEARDKAIQLTGFGLFSEQRVGKTLTALSIVDYWKPRILVVICPKKAIRVWREQLKEHIEFDWSCTKFVVHYEALCRSSADRRRWRRLYDKWKEQEHTVCTIVDEAHRIKRRGSAQSRMIRTLGFPRSDYRLALTGTPIAQGREDAWALFDFIMPGALGNTWEEFRNRYLKTEEEQRKDYSYKKIVGYKNTKRFDRIFHEYSYRKTLREAQKEAGREPYRVRRSVVRFDLKPESRRIYNELLTNLEAEVRKKKVSTPLVMTLVFKLQQLTGGYLIHTESLYDEEGLPLLTPRGKAKIHKSIIPIGREKIVELTNVLKQFPTEKKVVICVQYRHEINRIARRLERMGRTYQTIAGGESFDGKFNTSAVILQIRSGVAIDLADADTYILYSWNYSYIDYEQGRFRVLKFTSRQVNYIYLMARDSIDEDIYEAVVKKKNLAKLVCDKYRRKRR